MAELERQLPPPVAAVLPVTAAADSERLPMWLRVALTAVAVLLLLVGVAGLFLPGLQGIVTILAGIALLSLVSSHADRFLRWSLSRWPKLLAKVEELREKSRGRLVRLAGWRQRRSGCARPAGDSGASAATARPE